MRHLYIRHQSSQSPDERAFAPRPIDLADASPTMSAGQTQKPRITQRVPNISGPNVAPPIPLAAQREHCIWTNGHFAVDCPGEVNAQERKTGVGDWID